MESGSCNQLYTVDTASYLTRLGANATGCGGKRGREEGREGERGGREDERGWEREERRRGAERG